MNRLLPYQIICPIKMELRGFIPVLLIARLGGGRTNCDQMSKR